MRLFTTCFHCQNRERCTRLGCRAFNWQAREAHAKEEASMKVLIDEAVKDIEEVFKRKEPANDQQ